MHAKRHLNRILGITCVAVLGLSLSAAPAVATACNAGGCWNARPDFVRIGVDGKIWFTVENSAALNTLVPPDGCTLRTIWTGQAEPSLYIAPEDPRADELYTMLLTAFTTGSPLGFAPVKDPATGWCAVQYLYVK